MLIITKTATIALITGTEHRMQKSKIIFKENFQETHSKMRLAKSPRVHGHKNFLHKKKQLDRNLYKNRIDL